jgi:hypothetical protein
MAQTIKDSAKNFQPKTTKNISEISSIDVNLVLLEEEGVDPETGKPYNYFYTEINGEKYRVPATVLKDLKAILEKKPNLKTFAVNKTGKGKLDTRYTVIPLD